MASTTELDEYLSYGIDLKKRRIFFGMPISLGDEEQSDFSDISIEIAIRAIQRMVDDAPNKPIEIHMASYGGETYHMLRLYDFMLASPCQFKFFGGGPIMSAASFIMCACDERYLYMNTSVMMHELSDSFGDDTKHTDIKINNRENERLMDVLVEIYAANSRMPKEFWMEILQKDLYLTAQEALSLGLIDKIVEPKKRGNLRKVRQAILNKQPDSKEMKKLVTDIYIRTGRTKVPKLEFNDMKKEPTDPNVTIKDTESEAVSDDKKLQTV